MPRLPEKGDLSSYRPGLFQKLLFTACCHQNRKNVSRMFCSSANIQHVTLNALL